MARLGVPTWELMWNAGRAVGEAAAKMMPANGRVLVVAGPGNNGGDGFVAAELLRRSGRRVRVLDAGDSEAIAPSDAARARSTYRGLTKPLVASSDLDCDLVIDALFGAGLSRPLAGPLAELVEQLNARRVPILAVDLPSGVDGRTGAVSGPAIQAQQTVTFFRFKPGHLLYPGRARCGALKLAQIGIHEAVLGAVEPTLFHNGPDLWVDALPRLTADTHKYRRGHALVVSGPAGATGAARLAATAALRAGAGLVTLASPPSAMAENAAHLTAVMLRPFTNSASLSAILEDRRFTVVAIGPGAGAGAATREVVTACLHSAAALALDADALTAFATNPASLFAQIQMRSAPVIMTPHAGEFARLFPEIASDPNKVSRAKRAAAVSGALIALKGPDTVIATPDNRATINTHASAWLATAGSGDVLVGMVAGLLAGGMPAFEAASCAVWLHGDAGRRFGPGLTAEDLPGLLPAALRQFF